MKIQNVEVVELFKKIMKEYGISNDGPDLNDFFWDLDTKDRTTKKIENYDINLVHSDGGGEGQGDHVVRVIKLEKDGILIGFYEINGYYCSDYGTTWNEIEYWVEVFPREVISVQYFPKEQ